MKTNSSGYSLVEVLITVAIIVFVSVIVYFNINEATAESRDAERRGELRNMQSAIELYKQKNGRYPEGCNGPNAWSGEAGTVYACPIGDEYAIGLAPGFIRALPKDPKLNGNDSGYVYTTDVEGNVYKFMAMNTVETDVVNHSPTDTHEFYRCGRTVLDSRNECAVVPSSATGNFAYNTNGSTPGQCSNSGIYSNDYAVFGGYAKGGTVSGTYRTTDRAREYFSDIVRCK